MLSHSQVHLARVLKGRRAVADGCRYATLPRTLSFHGMLLSLCVLLQSCSSVPVNDTSVQISNYSEAIAYKDEVAKRSGFIMYSMRFWADLSIDEIPGENACASIDRGIDVDLVLLVDAAGRIYDGMAHSVSTTKAECYISVFRDARVKPPPFSPFPVNIFYRAKN
jgi:hypothetical protein